MAGRTISASDGALASARVIGTCLAMGYAAAIFAACVLTGRREAEVLRAVRRMQGID